MSKIKIEEALAITADAVRQYADGKDTEMLGAVVRHDVVQNLTAEQKARARKNMGISDTGAVGGTTDEELDITLTDEELKELNSTIDDLKALKTSNTSVIAFLTDLHIAGGTPTKIKKAVYGYNCVTESVKTDLLLFGGDYMDNNPTTTKTQAIEWLTKLREIMSYRNDTVPAAVIKGNHDDNTMHTDYINGLVDEETFWSALGNIDDDRTVRNAGCIEDCYGYYDIPNQKVRVFYVNTVDLPQKLNEVTNTVNYKGQWDTGISVKQLQFIADHLKFDEEGWRVMVFSHHPLQRDITIENGCGVQADRGGAALLELLDKFNKTTKTGSITVTGTGFAGTVTYDFSKNDDCKMIACVNGHTHRDNVEIYNESYFCISTRAVYGHPSYEGHTSSSAYFVVDRNNDKLHLLYNGDGEENIFDYGSLNTGETEPDEPTYEEIESPFEWQIGVLNDTTGKLESDSASMRISTIKPVGFTTAATIDMSANGTDLYQTYWYDADGNYIETGATWVSVSVPLEIPVGKMIGIKVRHNNYGLWDDTSINTFADKVSVYVEDGGEPYYPTPEIPMEVIESPYTFGINNLNYDTGEPVYDAKMFWVVSNEICAFTKPAKIDLSGYNCYYNIVLFDADGNYVGLSKENWTDKSITYEVPDGNYVRIFARNADWTTWTEEKVAAFTSAVEVSVQVDGEVRFLQLLPPDEPDEPDEPDGVTTVLYEDYSPNGESFVQTVEDIDFAAGDYIKAEIDISTCVNSMENILSFGTSIASWNNTANIHCYNNSGNAIQVNAVNTTNYSTAKNISSPNGICVLLLNKNGVYVNGTLLTAERFNNAQGAAEDPTGAVYTSVMNVIPTLSSIEIGSAEGAKRSNATYNYIKVVRMNESDEPDVPDVPDEPDEPTIELGKPLENVKYVIGGSVSSGSKGYDVYANAPRMTALVTYGVKPLADVNNVVSEDVYFIEIPADATKITVTCPGFIFGLQFFEYVNDAYNRLADPGWATLGGGSATFEAGAYTHVGINYKNSSNTNIPADTDTSGFSIVFD